MFHISVSPCGNIICIAYKKNIIVLHGKWDNNQIKYNISSRISLETNDEKYLFSFFILLLKIKLNNFK